MAGQAYERLHKAAAAGGWAAAAAAWRGPLRNGVAAGARAGLLPGGGAAALLVW